MRKVKLRVGYLMIFIGLFLLIPALVITTIVRTNLEKESPIEIVDEDIENHTIPVINPTTKIILPYTSTDVKVGKEYYDYKGEEKKQENAITQYENTYLQNTGIDYVSENKFDVISILEGTVIQVKEDDLLGKTIEIEHQDGYISIYQSLGEVTVKKGDIVNQGQIIGSSGTNELEKSLGNHLHFEMYDKGRMVDPNQYLNKEVSLKKN